MPRKYTKEMIAEVAAKSKSKADMLRHLGLIPAGGNYDTVSWYLTEYDIDTSHFSGKAWSKGKIIGPKVDIEEYLENRKGIKSYHLKARLLREGFMEPICNSCNLPDWLGEPIPLELDHINGKRNDNTITNLRLLCPNCHAKTPTYRGRNKKATY